MKLEINITKSHLYLILILVLVFISSFAIGQGSSNPSTFGHKYEEVDFNGKINGNDIAQGSITAENLNKVGPHVALNVLGAKNADAAACEFMITSCSTRGGDTGKECSIGYSPVPGEFGFSVRGRDRDYAQNPGSECIGSGIMVLCCKTL